MYQDPNNPIAPQAPMGPTVPPATPGYPNPAMTATPPMGPSPMPDTSASAPSAPNMPTIDPSLLQQAIADVPEEATATAPDVPSAVPLDSLGTASAPAPSPETSPYGATSSADFTTDAPSLDGTQPGVTPDATAPVMPAEEQKETPSVAFNDPAERPESNAHQVKMPAFVEKLKANPVALIIIGASIIIVALILIITYI